eukprot:gene19714-26405_t
MDCQHQYDLKFAQLLRKLDTVADDIVTQPEKAIGAIKRAYANVHTRANMTHAAWNHVKRAHALGQIDDATRAEWYTLYKGVHDAAKAVYDSNQPSAKQESAMIPYAGIVAVRDALPLGSAPRLLLGMYTHIDPLRNDFHMLEIFFDCPDPKPTHNYIVLGAVNTMYIQEYKTAKKYNTIVIALPPKLVFEITFSLRLHPRKHLFVMKSGKPYSKESSFGAWANAQLKKLLNNPDINLTMLRHIYITERTKDMTLAERKVTAKNMGHSVVMQLGYALQSN